MNRTIPLNKRQQTAMNDYKRKINRIQLGRG